MRPWFVCFMWRGNNMKLANRSSSFFSEHSRKKTSIVVETYKLDVKRLSAIYSLALTQASEKNNSEKCRTHLFYFSPHWKKRCTCFANRTVANILSSRTRAAQSRFESERRRAARVTAARVPCYSLAPPTAERSRAAGFNRSYDQRRERRWSRKNSFSCEINVF